MKYRKESFVHYYCTGPVRWKGNHIFLALFVCLYIIYILYLYCILYFVYYYYTQDQYNGKGIIFVGLDIVTPVKNNHVQSNDSDSLFWFVVMAKSTFKTFLDIGAFDKVEAYQVDIIENIENLGFIVDKRLIKLYKVMIK